jgi:hypothetical protein
MISQADAAAFLQPTFQILTGLSFALVLVIRFVAGKSLRTWSGRLMAFSVLFVALGCFLMSLGTAKSSFTSAAEMLTLGGVSYFLAAILVTTGLILAARRAD